MAGEVIRDVTVRVNVVNGNMSLGPIDASAITNGLRAISQTPGAQPANQIGRMAPVPSTVSQASGPGMNMNALGAYGTQPIGMNLAYGSPQTGAMNMARLGGYSNSLSSQPGPSLSYPTTVSTTGMNMNALQPYGSGGGMSSGVYGPFQSGVSAPVAPSAAPAAQAMGQASDSASAGILRLAKGLAQFTTATVGADESMVRLVVGIEGASNVISGAVASFGLLGGAIAALGAAAAASVALVERARSINDNNAHWEAEDALISGSRVTDPIHRRLSNSIFRGANYQDMTSFSLASQGLATDQALYHSAMSMNARGDLSPESREFQKELQSRQILTGASVNASNARIAGLRARLQEYRPALTTPIKNLNWGISP